MAEALSPHVWSSVLVVTHWVVAAGLAVRVIMRRRPVGVSLAWLALVFSLPFLVLCSGLGTFVTLLLVRWFPRGRMVKLVGLGLALGAAVVGWIARGVERLVVDRLGRSAADWRDPRAALRAAAHGSQADLEAALAEVAAQLSDR